MKQIVFNTQGTCSQQIILTGDKGRITDVRFIGGCNGNLQGISLLVRGMKMLLPNCAGYAVEPSGHRAPTSWPRRLGFS